MRFRVLPAGAAWLCAIAASIALRPIGAARATPVARPRRPTYPISRSGATTSTTTAHLLRWNHALGPPYAFSPDGRWLACGSGERDVAIWDVRRHTVRHVVHPAAIFQYSAAFSPNSRMLATGGHDEDVRLWDVASGRLVLTLKGAEYGNRVFDMAFTRDGKRLLAVTYHGFLEAWSVKSGRRLYAIGDGHRGWGLALAPDGRTVAMALNRTHPAPGSAIDVYAVRTGTLVKSYAATAAIGGGDDALSCVAFSPNGRLVASGSQQTLRLWDARTGRVVRTLRARQDINHEVQTVAFTPDGGRLLVGEDGGISLWDARTGTRLRMLVRGRDVSSPVLAPDGRRYAYSLHGRVFLRALPRARTAPESLQARLSQSLNADMTEQQSVAVESGALARCDSRKRPGVPPHRHVVAYGSPAGLSVNWTQTVLPRRSLALARRIARHGARLGTPARLHARTPARAG